MKTSKYCPFCDAQAEKLIDYDGEQMCAECIEFMTEKEQSQINDEEGLSNYYDDDLT